HQGIKAVGRPPKRQRVHEVRRAASENKHPKEPENAWKRDVLLSQDEGRQDRRNGEIRAPDCEIRDDIEPSMNAGPITTVPPRRPAFGVKKPSEEVEEIIHK